MSYAAHFVLFQGILRFCICISLMGCVGYVLAVYKFVSLPRKLQGFAIFQGIVIFYFELKGL